MMEVESQNDFVIITHEERSLIDKIRMEFKDKLPISIMSLSAEDQDLFFVRWLRARDLDLEKSTDMLRTSLKWRKERKADQAVHFQISQFFTDNYPYQFSGTDNHGRPVFLIPLADWDFRKVVNNAERLAEFDNFVICFFENICLHIKQEHEKRKNCGQKAVTQVMLIIDVKSYSYMQLINLKAMKKILQMASTYEAHYPEILWCAYFINCPSFFGLFIAILKPVVAAKTLNKITCYSQMDVWQKDLKEVLDPVQIPMQYGGTKEREDECLKNNTCIKYKSP